MTKAAKALSRRQFLLAAGAGGAAAAAAMAVHTNIASKPQPGKPLKRGYQASEHINNYYRTTKV